jgi:hypothetical protein
MVYENYLRIFLQIFLSDNTRIAISSDFITSVNVYLRSNSIIIGIFCFSNTEENNDSYIVVISVRSVYCQTEINKNDIDLNLFRYLHSRETQTEQQLSDEKKVRYSSIVI